MKLPLISAEFESFTPEAFHAHVTDMYAVQVKRGAKPLSAAPGLSIKRAADGGWRIRKLAGRTFAYVLYSEITALAKQLATNQSDLWNAFKQREFIIAKDRMAAETAYTKLKQAETAGGIMAAKMKKSKTGGKEKESKRAKGTGQSGRKESAAKAGRAAAKHAGKAPNNK